MTVERTDGWLGPITPRAWSALAGLGMERWLWLSMDPACPLGLAEELPQAKPPGMTHAWGWSGHRFVRVRLDRGLDGGLAGALLDVAEDPGTPYRKVRVDVVPGQTWDPLDGRVNPDPSHPVFVNRRLTRWVVTRHQDSGENTTLVPLSFLSLGSGGG